MDKVDYQREICRILSDHDTYRELPNNPTYTFKKDLVKLINGGFNGHILDKKEKAYLVPLVSRIPIMYHLPKIRKDPRHPPGCPIVSAIDYFPHWSLIVF